MGTPADIGTPLGIVRRILKVLLGLLFVVSAVLKIADMDPFEIYVYSYGFFSLNVSFIVARLAIILELVLGLGLIIGFFHKTIWWGSVLMLLGYSLLMGYALVLGRTDHCHCFGDLLRFNPWQSLLKNLVLLLLFLPLYSMEGCSFRGRWAVLIGLSLACAIAVFVVTPPDFLIREDHQEFQRPLFEEALHEAPLAELELDQGKKVVCLFSTGCSYCKMTARKLSLMQRFHGFSQQDVTYLFLGDEVEVDRFFEESESERYPYVFYEDVKRMIQFNNGLFPTVVLLQDGEVVHACGFRDMDEEAIKYFFQN